jgi:hypothetical protein
MFRAPNCPQPNGKTAAELEDVCWNVSAGALSCRPWIGVAAVRRGAPTTPLVDDPNQAWRIEQLKALACDRFT